MKTGKGLSQCTLEKHRFEGYHVRRQKHGLNFRIYVSASTKAFPGISKQTRYARALTQAKEKLAALDGVINDPKAWIEYEGGLKLSIVHTRHLTKLGFAIEPV